MLNIPDCQLNCCNACNESYYDLIDRLVQDIRHLEAKVVHLRFSLSNLLPVFEGEMLRCDIFSDLSGVYWDDTAYRQFMFDYCDGRDPMNSPEHSNYLMKLSRGVVTASL